MEINANFYKIPNKIFELGLSKNELLVLNYLLSLSNFKVIHPSKQTIANKTKLSKRSVDKAIEFLVEKGLLDYKKGFSFGSSKVCNQYKILVDKIDPMCIQSNIVKNEENCLKMIRNSLFFNK